MSQDTQPGKHRIVALLVPLTRSPSAVNHLCNHSPQLWTEEEVKGCLRRSPSEAGRRGEKYLPSIPVGIRLAYECGKYKGAKKKSQERNRKTE